MKGTMSEMELSIFRQRVGEARKLKAKRGELFGTIAVGYRKVAHEDRIEKEPDQRVQQAIKLVFKKFAEFQSAGSPLAAARGNCSAKHRVRSTGPTCRVEVAGL
jgi:DNA invertase Pin-like site-specific DNA recombinase